MQPNSLSSYWELSIAVSLRLHRGELTVIQRGLDSNSRMQRRCCPPYLLFKKKKKKRGKDLYIIFSHVPFLNAQCCQPATNQWCEPLRLLVPIRVPCDKFIILCLISGSTVRLMFYLLSKSTALLCKFYLTQTEDYRTKSVLIESSCGVEPSGSLSSHVDLYLQSLPCALTPSPLSSNLLQVEDLPL